MIAYRITHKRYFASAWDWQSASLNGGRWNSVGTPMVYTSPSLSLALLEIMVHLHFPRNLDHFAVLQLTLDDSDIMTLPAASLTGDWIAEQSHTRSIGDAFIASNAAAGLLVPSGIVGTEQNLLINPNHSAVLNALPDTKLVDFRLDPRLS